MEDTAWSWAVAAVVIATLMGPILAVQAQKWIESVRENRNRKMWLFTSLMATRMARLSQEHVRALNMIDLTFYGRHIFGFRWQNESERNVCDAWYAYLDALNQEASENDWSRRDDLFIKLMTAMATDTGFRFDRNQLTKSVYQPMAHWDAENEGIRLRKAALEVASGNAPLKMSIDSFPIDQEALAAQKELQKLLSAALESGVLSVKVKDDD